MNALLSAVLDAHGGLDRWNALTMVRATIVSGGDLFTIKGMPQDPTPREMTVWLHEEHASVLPFGAPDQRSDFRPDRVAVEKLDGHVVAERDAPRDSFTGHELSTPWDPLDRAYFNGYALWTYLTTPFLLAMPGFDVTEIAPWREGDELWRGLRATFPPGIASHSTHQDFYFGFDHLLRRHDYHVDVAGGFAAAQYVHDIVEADGIRLPTRRRAYRSDADNRPILEQTMVSIDVSDARFT
ncbi:hypothetical protein [Streptomyces olivochromogenes]|uniref:hypothetical protein n=1 Tax=Streptomyces olivochromogenes TaxID=1963 RepID=UPI001F24B01D|nr:hypothetical protein [Streptomyces olivochromogenes]MCF3130795.1 hypothetical protein [Streptomyces olivochromogenes]